MFDDTSVQCPYCGEVVSLVVESDVEGAFVQDCEVCCRPWAVHVTRDDDGEPSVSVERSD
jgi:hypothetical protein